MKKLINIGGFLIALALFSCESADDISNGFDHHVPDCKSLSLSTKTQNIAISDNISSLMLWGVVPQTNMEKITLPTLSVAKGDTIDISVDISDDVALKTAEMSYGDWLFSKYINFTNPEGNIPRTPKTFKFMAKVAVPDNAVSTPWLEDYYFNDGSSMKITQSYHKITLTVVDVNMNKRVIPIFVKVQ